MATSAELKTILLNNKVVIETLGNKFDRKAAKSLVMPLIYGKTGIGVADDLKAFLEIICP